MMAGCYSNAIFFSDLSFIGKFIFFINYLIKSAVLFGIFIVSLVLKNLLCFSKINRFLSIEDGTLLFAIILLFYCIIYDIYFIFSEGILNEMLGGVIISIVGGILCGIFPPLGIIIAIFGLISIIKSVIGVVKMIPYLLLGVLITVLLFADSFIGMVNLDAESMRLIASIPRINLGFLNIEISYLTLPYLTLCAIVSLTLAFKYSLKMAMFRQTVIFLSLPIMILMFYFLKSALEKAICRPGEMQQTSIQSVGGKKAVIVQPYFRSDGTLVSGYTKWI